MFTRFLMAAVVALGALHGAHAQYPENPVRIIVGFAPGGPTDVIARLVAERLTQLNGQNFIVDNKPGAAAVIAAQEVIRARPDGYTLLMTGTNHAATPAILSKTPYDTARDFSGIMLVAEGPHVLVANPQVPFASVKELVAYAKTNPNKIAYSSSGRGGTVHFAGAMFEEAAGVELNHVPYKGAAPAVQDLLGGQVQLSFATLASVNTHVKSGRLKLMAVAAPQRLAEYPSVPTFAELGYPGVVISAWAGLLAPAATPRPILEKLAAQLKQVIALPEVKQRLQGLGMEPIGSTLKDFDAQIAREFETFTRIAKARGIVGDE
jgi:tripartite-type tricarboxylate transporter receptor subunit TctC